MRATALGLFTLTVIMLSAGLCPAQAPVVISHTPGLNELNVATDVNIAVIFNVDMQQSTINQNTFFVKGSSSGLHTGSFLFGPEENLFLFWPTYHFFHGEVVTVTMTDAMLSQDDLPIDAQSWSFTVEAGCGEHSDIALRESYHVGNYPRSLIAADFNNDRYNDIATTNSSDDSVAVLLNNGDGTFATPASTYLAGSSPWSIITIDMLNDHRLFLAVANYDDNTVKIFLNHGDGTFEIAYTDYSVGTHPSSINSADFNNDGSSDLVTANSGDNNISVLIRGGWGFIIPAPSYSVGISPNGVFPGDFDNDGYPDIVTSNYGDDQVSILLNDGDGTFDDNYSTSTVEENPRDVCVADLNNDGSLDIAAACEFRIAVLLNNGSGNFPSSATSYFVGTADEIFSSDIDGDGDLDLVTNSTDEIIILLNNGDGTFVTPYTGYMVSNGILDFFPADLDNDGDLDLAMSENSDSVSIFENLSEPSIYELHPAQEEQNVAVNEIIFAEFDIQMDETTIDTGSFKVYGSLSGRIEEYDNEIETRSSSLYFMALFNALNNFQYGETVNAILTDDIANLECSGNISPYIWSFTVKAEDGTSLYDPYVDIPIEYSGSPAGTHYVCAGDFNNDGLPDLAAACADLNRVAVLIQDIANPGTFLGPQFTPTNVGTLKEICAADLNGDGWMDLATLDNGTGGSPYTKNLNVYINDGINGNPTYFPDISSNAFGAYDTYPYQVKPADFDGDGDLDLVVTDEYNYNPNYLFVFYNSGDGINFERESLFFGGAQKSLCIADFDGDGDQDIATSNFWAASIYIYFNEGNRVFDRYQLPDGLSQPRPMCAGDFNKDGLPDIAVVNEKSGGDDSLMILLNDPADPGHSFANTSYYLGYWIEHPYDIWTGDLNENGYLDLVIGLSGSYVSYNFYVKVLLNNANEPDWGPAGTFYTDSQSDPRYSQYTTTGNGNYAPRDICLADFTGEGSIDIATIGPDCVTLLTNIPTLSFLGHGGGIVVDPNLVPISEVYVEIRTPGPSLSFEGDLPQYNGTPGSGSGLVLEAIDSCYTDQNGYFEFYVPSGTYDLWFSHENFHDTLITGIVIVVGDSTIIPDIPMEPSGCDYVVGDANGSGGYNGLDITYGVSFFKGGNDPICDTCILCPGWFYCGDVNGSCNYNGLDVTYGVNFLKGIGPDRVACADCPPISGVTARVGGKSEYKSIARPAGTSKGANLKMKR